MRYLNQLYLILLRLFSFIGVLFLLLCVHEAAHIITGLLFGCDIVNFIIILRPRESLIGPVMYCSGKAAYLTVLSSGLIVSLLTLLGWKPRYWKFMVPIIIWGSRSDLVNFINLAMNI